MSFAGNDESFVFVRRNIPGSVFSQPKLASDKIPDDVRLEWESKILELKDWSTEFQAINGMSEPPLTSDEIHTEEAAFLAESNLLRTLAKRKKDSFGGKEYEGPRPVWKNARYERTMPEDEEELEELITEGVRKGMITTAVSKIETYISDFGNVFQEATTLYHDRLVELEDNLEIVLGMVQTLKSGVGVTANIGEKFSAPTLWGVTGFMADDIAKLGEDFLDLKEEIVPIRNAFQIIERGENEAKMSKVLSLVVTRIKEIKGDLEDVCFELTQKEDLVLKPEKISAPADDMMEFILAEDKAGSPD